MAQNTCKGCGNEFFADDPADKYCDPCRYDDYGGVTPLEWAEYEFATIEYDYKVHPKAAEAIRAIFKRLAKSIDVEADAAYYG